VKTEYRGPETETEFMSEVEACPGTKMPVYCAAHPLHLSGECPHERGSETCSCQLPFPAQKGDFNRYPPHSEECCCKPCLGISENKPESEPDITLKNLSAWADSEGCCEDIWLAIEKAARLDIRDNLTRLGKQV
jgi:hypothetical protein